MSIEKRAYYMPKVRRTLIKRQPSEQRHIKDLKDLRFIVERGAIDIKVLQTLSPERKPHFFRSAGACPPRSLPQNDKRPKPRGHGRLLLISAHGEGQALALR